MMNFYLSLHSAQLHNEVAALARHLANNIVEWPHIRH